MTILTSYLCCVLTRLREEVKNDKCELVFADVPVPMNCDNFHLRISRVLPTMQFNVIPIVLLNYFCHS